MDRLLQDLRVAAPRTTKNIDAVHSVYSRESAAIDADTEA